MKITRKKLLELVNEVLEEDSEYINGMSVAGSYGSTGITGVNDPGKYDSTTHAEAIASSYGRGDDQEAIEKIHNVLNKMMQSEEEMGEASSMLTDMLYCLFDKEKDLEGNITENKKKNPKKA
jgi:hypothetical protein